MQRDLRAIVAREAARLLYFGVVEEYYAAKRLAAENLGVNVLPSNREIALALDEFADLIEGEDRAKRLVKMREDALELMLILKDYRPRLIGSVWRGTITRNSDIDIEVFSENVDDVVETLIKNGIKEIRVEEVKKHTDDLKRVFIHIKTKSRRGFEVDIAVRDSNDHDKYEICEIFGDLKKGLSIKELKRVLRENPVQKFVPI
ncbi:MAG: nucleotidyltransferase domain-containing protein [Candidatus Baldrarchaeia archaeon]